MKYGELTPGQTEAIVNKLGGMEGVKRFLSGETVVVKELERRFKVWRTIKLGTSGLRGADDFRKVLKAKGFRISTWANDILGKPAFTVAAEETEIDLVVVSVAELGFKDGAKRKQIYTRAKELGLELCPAEIGPQLRLQHNDQPNGEWVLVAMEPIADSDGDLGVFSVGRDGSGLWLSGRYGAPDNFWNAVDQWVFRLPRK